MLTFGLDIETIPNPVKAARLPEPEIKLGNIKNPAKIAERQDAARAKQLKDMALDAATGRVLAVGMHNDEGEHCEVTAADSDEAEREVLDWTMKVLDKGEVRIITWNGKDFDLPFIFKRAAILGINAPNPLSDYVKRYDRGIHIDLMKEWDMYQAGVHTSLDFFANMVLGTSKEEIDFDEFPKLMKTEEGRKKIKEYCLQDCRLPYQGWKLLRGRLF